MSLRVSKLIGWCGVGLLIFAYIHHVYVRQQAEGYDAFIAQQAYRYQHTISHPNWISILLACFFLSWLLLGCYELIQYGLGKYHKNRTNET